MDWSWFEARIYRFNDESITSGQSIESGTIMNATCQYGYEGRMYMVECGYGKLTVMNPPYSMEKPPPCNRSKYDTLLLHNIIHMPSNEIMKLL